MLGVGWTEMLVIGVVALIVIGPKELPNVMRRVGQFAGTLRRMGNEFQRELNKTTGLNEIKNLRDSVTQPLKATADAIRKEFNTTTATGQVQPSGALKPADPKAGSVVNEIKAAAGMTPAAAAAPVMQPATAAAAPAKAARTVKAAPRIKAPVEKPVEVADIPPAGKTATRVKKPIESPAPVEAIAPAKPAARKPAARKPVAAKAAAAAAPAIESPAPKPAAARTRKPAAPKKS